MRKIGPEMKPHSLPLDLMLWDGGALGGGTRGRVAVRGEKVSKSHGGGRKLLPLPFPLRTGQGRAKVPRWAAPHGSLLAGP